MPKELRYCPHCNTILDEENYCPNCYLAVEEANFKGIERFTKTYNLFFAILFVFTLVFIYLASAGLFSELLSRSRTEELFGIRVVLLFYVFSPVVVFLLYYVSKTIQEGIKR
jgi:hypothetical protein